jgi:hypothetical protein
MLRTKIWLLMLGVCLVGIGIVTPVFAQDGGDDDLEIDLTPPAYGDFDPASVQDIVLEDYPLLPEMTDHARLIYARGQEAGNNPRVFSKVGDCMTAAEYYLTAFGLNDYDLGEYSALQPVIDYFAGTPARTSEGWELDSFANPGLATTSGFNTVSVQDALWADPEWCEANESPLACEYRVSQPAFAIIMFGTNDTYFFEAVDFDYNLRLIVLQTIENNIVPIMSTFPIRPEYPEKSILFNQIIIKIAEDYDLPLMNFWLGLEDLPSKGVDEVDTIHLTKPEDSRTGIFTEETLITGYTYRNLVTLQALEALLQALAEEEASE